MTRASDEYREFSGWHPAWTFTVESDGKIPFLSYILQFALPSWRAVPNLLAVPAGLAVAAWLGARRQPQIRRGHRDEE